MTILRTISIPAAALLGAMALAACGGSSGSAAPASTASTPADTVSTADVSGVGTVLVDAKGNALYTPDQEASGTIRCTDACTSIWVPLTVGGGEQPSGVDGLGVLKRPDGAEQVTFDGKPLYTFVEDPGPRTVTGNGFKDSFGGTSFTWHVAAPGAVSGNSSTGSTGGGYGY
jgi:predicted lipoprotein with Yx(FWY)xxD motif